MTDAPVSGLGIPRPSTTIYFAKRERQVLAQIVLGVSNKQIEKNLHMRPGTVKNHIASLLDKLGVCDRYELRTWGLQYSEAIVKGWAPAGLKLHPFGCGCGGSYCLILKPISEIPKAA